MLKRTKPVPDEHLLCGSNHLKFKNTHILARCSLGYNRMWPNHKEKQGLATIQSRRGGPSVGRHVIGGGMGVFKDTLCFLNQVRIFYMFIFS